MEDARDAYRVFFFAWEPLLPFCLSQSPCLGPLSPFGSDFFGQGENQRNPQVRESPKGFLGELNFPPSDQLGKHSRPFCLVAVDPPAKSVSLFGGVSEPPLDFN